jgi:hypothetical protein
MSRPPSRCVGHYGSWPCVLTAGHYGPCLPVALGTVEALFARRARRVRESLTRAAA